MKTLPLNLSPECALTALVSLSIETYDASYWPCPQLGRSRLGASVEGALVRGRHRAIRRFNDIPRPWSYSRLVGTSRRKRSGIAVGLFELDPAGGADMAR